MLTPRELEVLRLMPTHSSKEIARELGIAADTVRNHQYYIRQKLGIVGGGRTRTVLKGIELGLINLD